MNRLSVLLIVVSVAAFAVAPADPVARPRSSGHVDPRVAVLRAEEQAALAAGNEELAREIEARLQAIYTAGQPTPKIEVLPVADVPREPAGDAPDITVVTHAGKFAAHATDYQMDGTMFAAVSFRFDSACRIYRSTNHGYTWGYLAGFTWSPRSLVRKLQLVVGEGDSAKVYVMCMHHGNDGDLQVARFNMDGSGLAGYGIFTGVDTVSDFAACRDYSGSNYWLYAVAHNGARPGTSPPSYICRSTNYGKNWATVDTFYNCNRPHMAAGAGNHIYLSSVPNQNNWKGWVGHLISNNWGANGSWTACSNKPDTDLVYDGAIAPAFTTPPASAVVWSAYSHRNLSVNRYEILALHTTNAGANWLGPTTVYPGPDPGYVDLRNYYDPGNTYMNVSYNDRGTVYRQFVNAPTPTNWSDTLRISQTYGASLGINVGPQVCYSPGGGAGGGAIWLSSDSTRILWNAPWVTGIGSGRGDPPLGRGLGVAPNPGYARLQFDWSGPARSLAVFDRTGRLVRRFDARAGSSLAWDRTDACGRSASAGVYLARLQTDSGIVTRSFVLR